MFQKILVLVLLAVALSGCGLSVEVERYTPTPKPTPTISICNPPENWQKSGYLAGFEIEGIKITTQQFIDEENGLMIVGEDKIFFPSCKAHSEIVSGQTIEVFIDNEGGIWFPTETLEKMVNPVFR